MILFLICKDHLKTTLTNCNFIDQLHELQQRDAKIHIHNVTIKEIKNSASNTRFFICDHC